LIYLIIKLLVARSEYIKGLKCDVTRLAVS
jgi:hypothetical protein